MARVMLIVEDTGEGTINLTVESDPPFDMKDDSKNTLAQRIAAFMFTTAAKEANGASVED